MKTLSLIFLVLPLPAAEKPRLSFVKDIVPIFTKSGCANSNCHGSIRGQAGFKLSLFGYEPDLDYEAIVKESNGRRIDLKQPEKSLILLKPTFLIAHGGGERFKPNSLEYTGILEWLRDGAPYDSTGSPRLATLSVQPEEQVMVGIGSFLRLEATATYTDGQTENVTRKVQYTANDPSVVEISPAGEVKALRAGETAIMVRTLGKAAAARIAVVLQSTPDNYPVLLANNFIDDEVNRKLRRLNILPSALADDRTFLRRVYLDTVGMLPTLEEQDQFIRAPNRPKLIDQLLKRPQFAELWATRFADLFRVGLLDQGSKGGRLMYNWLRKAMLEDKPYNQFATELITATGNLFYNPTANFYYITERSEPENLATNVSQIFLGVRLECARCHNHPWEKWTQDDFWGFAAFFGRMDVKDTYKGDESQILLKDRGEVIHPKTKKPVQPKYLDGPSAVEGPDDDIREDLSRWITGPKNPWFAHAIVNRLWKHYMGRGLVEPVDDFRVTNPPTNQLLLDALARDFVTNGYSLRQTARKILNSAAYQLSSEPNESNRGDVLNYSRYYLKRLMAEQLMDAVVAVTGMPEKYPGFPPGTRAMAIPQGAPTYFLKTFGRMQDREKICERDDQPDIAQAMHLISGETIQKKINGKGGTLDRLLQNSSLSDEEIIRRCFRATLVRDPTPRELAKAMLTLPAGRREALEDTMWALLNSKEFLHNH